MTGLIRRDRPAVPFRCLDPQYRRELVRVYLTNVEGICRRFVEEKREQLGGLAAHVDGFKAFWQTCSPAQRVSLTSERADVILKVGGRVRVCAHLHKGGREGHLKLTVTRHTTHCAVEHK